MRTQKENTMTKKIVKFFFVFLLINMGSFVIINMVFLISFGSFDIANAAIYSQAFSYIGVFLIFKNIRSYVLDNLSFSFLKQKRTYLIIFISLILIWIGSFVFIDILGLDKISNQQNIMLNSNSQNLIAKSLINEIIKALFIVFLFPFFEEFIFRGLLFRFLCEKRNFWLALLVSSSIFGLLHNDLFLTMTTFGAILVLANHYTKSILTGIIIHIIWNSQYIINILQTTLIWK